MRLSVDVKRQGGASLKPLRKGDFAELGEVFRSEIVTQSRAGTGADGRRFKTLEDGSPSTITRTGALLAGVRVSSVSGEGVEVRPSAEYAADVHAERPFMGISPTTAATAADAIADAFRANVALSDIKNRRLAKATRTAGVDDSEDEGDML